MEYNTVSNKNKQEYQNEIINCEHCSMILKETNPNHYRCSNCGGGRFNGEKVTNKQGLKLQGEIDKNGSK